MSKKLITAPEKKLRYHLDQMTACDLSYVEHAVSAGDVMAEQKHRLSHGDWTEWIKANWPKSSRIATDYMRIAVELDRPRVLECSSIREAKKLLTHVPDEGSNRKRASDLNQEPPVNEPVSDGDAVIDSEQGHQSDDEAFDSDCLPGDQESIVRDSIEREVPSHLQDAHGMSAALITAGNTLNKLIRDVDTLSDNPGGEHLQTAMITSKAKEIKGLIQDARYYTVCPKCLAKLGSKCGDCRGIGFIPHRARGSFSEADKGRLGI